MTHNIFDRTLKIIARNHADTLLKLAFPQHKVQLVGTVDNVEISLSVKPVDFVHHVIFDGEPYLFHLEFQLEHKAYLPRRTFITSAELTEQFDVPVLTVFLYVRPRKKAIPAVYTTKLGRKVINRFTYPVVKLWDYVDAIRQGRHRALAPLLVLLVKEPDEHLLEEEKNLILQEPDPQKRADLLAAAVAIASRYFVTDFLWQFFSEEVEQMKGATFIDQWITDGIERGHAKGLTEGRAKGLAEGRAEGVKQGLEQGVKQGLEQGVKQGLEQGLLKGSLQVYRDNVSEILQIRFGVLSPFLLKRLYSLDDISVLKILLRQAATIDSVANFEALLTDVFGYGPSYQTTPTVPASPSV